MAGLQGGWTQRHVLSFQRSQLFLDSLLGKRKATSLVDQRHHRHFETGRLGGKGRFGVELKFAQFQFNPEASLPSEATGLEMSMVALIYEGSRLSFPEERIEEQLRTLERQYVALSPTALESSHRAGLGEEERQFLASIDGRKRVSELRELQILPPIDTDRLLYALKCTRLADFSDSAVAHSRFDLH